MTNEKDLNAMRDAECRETAAFHKKLLTARSSPAKRKKLGFTMAEIDYLIAVIRNGLSQEDALYSLKKYGPGERA